jgi:hypothetical protein
MISTKRIYGHIIQHIPTRRRAAYHSDLIDNFGKRKLTALIVSIISAFFYNQKLGYLTLQQHSSMKNMHHYPL